MSRPASAPVGLRVFAYRNLHKGCWSLKAMSGPDKGRVVAHCQDVALAACELRVSEAGRRRVLREGRKNVHAGVVGYVLAAVPEYAKPGLALRYNPREGATFTVEGRPVGYADVVHLAGRPMAWGVAQ